MKAAAALKPSFPRQRESGFRSLSVFPLRGNDGIYPTP